MALDRYCSFSWSLCEKGEDMEKELVKLADEMRAHIFSDEYLQTMYDALDSVREMNDKFKRLYKCNRSMYGAYYEDGKKKVAGIPF